MLIRKAQFILWKTLLLIADMREEKLIPLSDELSEAKMMEEEAKKASTKRVRQFYMNQAHLLQSYEQDKVDVMLPSSGYAADNLEELKQRREAVLLSKLTLLANVLLLVAKTVAAAMSGSFSVISSVVDSGVDISSGLIIWLTSRAVKKRDLRVYPRGRTRLEPLALVLISFIMGSASIQLICKSLEAIMSENVHPDVKLPTISIMVITVLLKLTLWITCCCYNDPNIKVLAQDHCNDCVSNTCAIACAYLGDHYWNYLDPIGAILISFYLLGSWVSTGIEQISIISGKAASPVIVSRIIKVCLDHSPLLQHVETVLAYHFGHKYLVEVHIVLDENTSLKKAHDISEPLQQKIERLPFVERAFVHVDYECCHRPESEHKIV
ncbi:cation efflux family protein [Trichuris trichiura]|uniref:Cation efflux family protein n=1 Tax=Trichuris trichiura TaxID=36087 RepID=A0A077ZC71_TRITR|nr:cation efflux family protein [Trichuris trichiura]